MSRWSALPVCSSAYAASTSRVWYELTGAVSRVAYVVCMDEMQPGAVSAWSLSRHMAEA